MLTPIMLQCHARSGSTVFMLILSCADGVFFCNEYPFEERDLTYMVRLVNLATKPIDKTLRNDFLSPYLDALRGYPYHGAGAFFDATDEARENLFMTLWEGYSASARKKGDYKYYAEKVAFDVIPTVNSYIGSKNIFLIRDPRAVFNSILEFDERRGYYAFGRQPSESIIDYAERFWPGQKGLMRHFSTVQPSENQLKLRYEDVIGDLSSTVREIEAFLGCGIDMDRLKREFSNFSGLHATSRTASDSVDAWNTKLPDEVKALLTERLGEELTLLGYL